MDNLNDLLTNLKDTLAAANWLEIAKECPMEKQIEIQSELKRTIKKVEKEIKANG